MNFIEYGRKTFDCGTIAYSYLHCEGGYLINVRNIDTGAESNTAGINVHRSYMRGIMERLMENDITPGDASAFLFNEMNNYLELYPPAPKKAHSKYLYL